MRTETKKPLITTKAISELVQMLIGNAICAFSVVCFALPYNMVVSGMSGIGRMANYATGMSVSLVVGIFNVLLFVIGAAMLGKKFAATIALGTFAFPFFMGIFEQLTMLHHLVEEPEKSRHRRQHPRRFQPRRSAARRRSGDLCRRSHGLIPLSAGP